MGLGKGLGQVEAPTRHIIAAIPAYNEENAICSVIVRARHHVDEVIVIDDGSTDHTARLADGAGATVIRHDRNRGKAAGIMTAFGAAAERHADVLVLLDGDGQHDPAEIPQLIAPVLAGEADVVVGSRFLEIQNPIPFYRTIGQRVLNVATHLGSGLRCSDSQSGFRALNHQAFTAITLQESFLHGLAVESEMQFEMAEAGLRLAEVPIYVRYDEKARRSPIKHGFGVLYRVLAMTSQRRKRLISDAPAR
ncbi:MAG TPA: glycosyltransferase family 2 protein, partial [Nitrolancea sp.]|nr:glycosyltransferase family 2 protein [Nitrolancea sp.]